MSTNGTNKLLKELIQGAPTGQGATGAHLKTDGPKPHNFQLFKNSGLAECEAPGDPLWSFFNSKDPNLAILKEKPEHRLMLYMKAQGCSNTEIARHSGYSIPWVSQLFRQPWAKLVLLQLMNEVGVNKVQVLLEGAAEDSVMKLIELRDNPAVPSAVQRGSATDLLDRFLGKPKQQVEVTTKATPQDMQELDQEIKLLEAEESRLLGGVVTKAN